MIKISWFNLTLLCATIISMGCGEADPVFPSAKLEGTITIKSQTVEKGTLQVISKDKVGLVAQGHHDHGDGEQDQAFEMVVQRALQPGGGS